VGETMTKIMNLNEHPEFFALLARDRMIGETQFGCDITAAPLSNEQRDVIQMVKQGLAAGTICEVRPGIFKYTERGIAKFRENATPARRPARW
jgi:hypothetical protein